MKSTKNVSQDTGDDTTLGARVKEVRIRAGLSLQELGDKIGFGKSYISKVERGVATNCSEKFIHNVCEVLDVNKNWLLSGNKSVSQETYSDLDSKHRQSVEWRRNQEFGAFPAEYSESYKPQTSPRLRAMSRNEICNLIEEALPSLRTIKSGPALTNKCHYIMDFFYELSNRREDEREL